MIYITADHGGWQRKEQLKAWLRKRGITVHDLVPNRPAATDDYPIRARDLGQYLVRGRHHLGLAVCRSGVGMAIALNKIHGLRAAQAFNPRMAAKSRTDENTNVLSLDAEYTSDKDAQKIVMAWLKTRYVRTARYERRLRQLKSIERAG